MPPMAPHIIISIIFRIIKTTMGMKQLIQPLGKFKGKMNQIFHIKAILYKNNFNLTTIYINKKYSLICMYNIINIFLDSGIIIKL